MAITFRYGSYTHEAGTCDLSGFTQRVIYTPRGRPYKSVKEMTVRGFVKGTSEADLTNKIQALEAAYAVDGNVAGLVLSNGTYTPHVLSANDSVSGVRVLSVDYPEGGRAEYTNARRFAIRLMAEYAVPGGSELIDYVETIAISGTGGPRFAVHELRTGLPVIEQVSVATPVRIVQAGSATGFSSYPAANSALNIPGAVLLGPECSIGAKAPTLVGNTFQNYGVQWQYVFVSATPTIATPISR